MKTGNQPNLEPGKTEDSKSLAQYFQDPKYNAVLSLLEITPETLGMYTIPGVDQDITVRALERYAACNKKIDTQALEQFDIKPYIWGLLKAPSMQDQLLGIDLLNNLDVATYMSAQSLVFESSFPVVWRKWIHGIKKESADKKQGFADDVFEKLRASEDNSVFAKASLFINAISSDTFDKSIQGFIDKILEIKDLNAIGDILAKCSIRKYDLTDAYPKIISIAKDSIQADKSLDTHLLILSYINHIPEAYQSDRIQLLEALLDSDHQDVWIACIQMVDSFLYNDSDGYIPALNCGDLPSIISEKAKKYIDSKDKNEQLLVAYSINHFDLDTIRDLLDKFGIKDQDSKAIDGIHPEAVCQMLVSSKRVEGSVKSLNNNKEAGLLYIQSELYKKDFVKKGGAELSVLQNGLRGKSIVRHFSPAQFLAWKQLYENHALWKEQGFDYVPVEPIQAFYQRASGRMDVYTGVLDCNLSTRLNTLNNGLWSTELLSDIKKIQSVFKNKGFLYEHTRAIPRAANCVLRFYKKEDGSVDFEKKPRIYVTDFDHTKGPTATVSS